MDVDVERHQFDVLVIGAGGAGMRAAIASSEAGARTGLVCKSLLGKAHTVMAEGGVAAAFGNVAPEDNWKVHFQDTMFGAKYLNNWHMAELHAKEAPDRVAELEHWGGIFDRTPDRRMDQRAFGGHTHRRLVHIGDRTGLELIRTLQDKTVHSGVDVFMECTMTRLLKDGDRVCGAFGYRRATGTFIAFEAKSVVLATGGAGRCWKITSNSGENAGDGHALAYEAGAELIDMEFIQFHPTGMVWPPGVIGLLVTEAVRGEGGILRNAEGERFMERYDPKRLELSTRDVVARAIYTEVREGRGTPHGGVFLDVSHLPADTVKTRLPSMYDQFMELAGVDITREPMEVGPTCHYMMGGVSVDGETGASRVPGLFATGECTGGMNGANRLGGNSLSDLLVFGRRAGEGAAGHATGASAPVIDEAAVADAAAELLGYLERRAVRTPTSSTRSSRRRCRPTLGSSVRRTTYRRPLTTIERLREQAKSVGASSTERAYNAGWQLCRDLRNMLIVSEAVARAAQMRHESRGAHSRLDFPNFDDYWGEHNIVVRKQPDGMQVDARPVIKAAHLAELVDAKKEAERG